MEMHFLVVSSWDDTVTDSAHLKSDNTMELSLGTLSTQRPLTYDVPSFMSKASLQVEGLLMPWHRYLLGCLAEVIAERKSSEVFNTNNH